MTAVRHWLQLLAVVALLIGVSACGAEDTPEPEMPTPADVDGDMGDTEEGEGDADMGAEDTGSTTPPDTIVFAHPSDAAKLDPADVTDGESLLVTWHIYDGLTRYNRGTTEPEPALATDWEVSDDGLQWTFNLREGVTFHDGEPFNAEAVVWNFNRWFDESHPQHFDDWEFAYFADMFQGYMGQDRDEDGTPDSFLESVEAVDELTVQLNLRRPNAPLLQTLAMGNFGFSSPAAVEAAGSSYGTPDGSPIAAGTGPYMVDSWQPGENITVVENPDYWGEPPEEPSIIFSVIPENNPRYLALASGEIDGMNQVNPEDIEDAEANPDVQVILEPANNVGYLGFNQAHEPWGNQDCRMAVAQAIDKDAIVQGLYAGDAEPANQMMPPSLWGYNDSITDYGYDVDAAQSSLDACLESATLPDEVVLYVPPIARFYFPQPAELGEEIQSKLSALGINATIRSPEWATWLTEVRSGEADLFLLGWGGDNGDPDNFLCVFFCGGDGAWNSDAEGNPLPPDAELNDLLREAATLSSQSERAELYQQANQMVHDKVLAVPLVHRSPPILFRSNVTGYVPSPIQTILTTVSKE